MEITVQQKGGWVSRRNFKLKNGFYENSAYNDGGVPTHYIIVAWLQEPDMHKWDDVNPISKCHHAEILIYHDRPMCIECKMYCEVVDGQRPK